MYFKSKLLLMNVMKLTKKTPVTFSSIFLKDPCTFEFVKTLKTEKVYRL